MICVACSIFKYELAALQRAGQLRVPVRYLNSMLHIYPTQLRQALDKVIAAERQREQPLALIYGECHAYLQDALVPGVVERVQGLNCIEILLGRETYRGLRRAGVFFLLPEWARRWQEIFQVQLGLNQENARTFMQEMHTQFLYLDTGITPIPYACLHAMVAYTGLPLVIQSITLIHLAHALQDVRSRLSGGFDATESVE
jgi:hypothetical protein